MLALVLFDEAVAKILEAGSPTGDRPICGTRVPWTFDEKGFHLFWVLLMLTFSCLSALSGWNDKSSATAHANVDAKLRKKVQTFIFGRTPLLQ